MAAELPYLVSYKNVGELFRKIASAKQPEVFTTRFLNETLGLASSTDRPLIALLKALGFIDSSGKPTEMYGALKNPKEAGRAIAYSIRKAYEPLFAANEKANELQGQDLRGLISQVAGSDAPMTTKIAGTFNALVKLAEFVETGKTEEKIEGEPSKPPSEEKPIGKPSAFGALRPEFHYNIQVHLPTNATEETYLNIFNALRKAFK
jgi:hypothetical protein